MLNDAVGGNDDFDVMIKLFMGFGTTKYGTTMRDLFSAGGDWTLMSEVKLGGHSFTHPFPNHMSPAGAAFQTRTEKIFLLKFKIAWARSDSKDCSAISRQTSLGKWNILPRRFAVFSFGPDRKTLQNPDQKPLQKPDGKKLPNLGLFPAFWSFSEIRIWAWVDYSSAHKMMRERSERRGRERRGRDGQMMANPVSRH